MVKELDEARTVARQLISEGLAELAKLHVIPRSRYQPWIHVGADYEGSALHYAPSINKFKEALEATFPDRFRRDVQPRDFADHWAFPLLEAVVARLTLATKRYSVSEPEVDELIDEFLVVLSRDAEEGISIRMTRTLNYQTTLNLRSAV